MIQAFLDLPAFAEFLILTLLYGGCAILIAGLTMWWPSKSFFARFRGIVAPFFGACGLLFGLLTGFLANDVSTRNHNAWDAVATEADSLTALRALSIGAPSDLSAIREAIGGLIRSELNDEWPRMDEHRLSPATDEAYVTLLEKVATPSVSTNAGQTVQSSLLTTALRAGSARSRRIAVTSDRGDDIAWVCVLVLALLTQLSVGLVHFERAAPQAAALTVFTAAIIVTLTLVALQEDPFSGPRSISPAPLAEVLRAMNQS